MLRVLGTPSWTLKYSQEENKWKNEICMDFKQFYVNFSGKQNKLTH